MFHAVETVVELLRVVVAACDGHGGLLGGVRYPGLFVVDWVLIVVVVAFFYYGSGVYWRGVAVGLGGAVVVGGCSPEHLVAALAVVGAVTFGAHRLLRVTAARERLLRGPLSAKANATTLTSTSTKTLKPHPLSRPVRPPGRRGR